MCILSFFELQKHLVGDLLVALCILLLYNLEIILPFEIQTKLAHFLSHNE